MNARQAALATIESVINEQRSLSTVLETQKAALPAIERPLFQMLVYGTLRQYGAFSYLHQQMLLRPLPKKQHAVRTILNLGLNQLLTLNLADHAVLHETVHLAKVAGFPQCKGLVNALLRRVQRERKHWQSQLQAVALEHNLPAWLRDLYPAERRQIAIMSSSAPPFTVRLRAGIERAAWLAENAGGAEANPLHPQAITLPQGTNLADWPDFAAGKISVQDAAAQHAATILAPRAGEKILDACAAPGGKTGHILELAPTAEVDALDHDPARLEKVRANLERLAQSARCVAADAGKLEAWWQGEKYDAILLDAPCSGSGILRRHPDIAFLRTAGDLQRLPKTQMHLLRTLWPTLKTGGRLLYTTCSILPQENEQIIARFMAQEKSATLLPVTVPETIATGAGWVHLPSAAGDGFFYALLQKK